MMILTLVPANRRAITRRARRVCCLLVTTMIVFHPFAEAPQHILLHVALERELETALEQFGFAEIADDAEEQDAGRPAFLVQIVGFERPLEPRAAEHEDRIGLLERVLDDQPASGVVQQKARQDENRRHDQGALDDEAFQLFLERDELPAPKERGPERGSNYKFKSDLPFNKSNVSRSRTLLGFLDREVDTLAFPQQFEHRAPH
jgi:hypothetical protein